MGGESKLTHTVEKKNVFKGKVSSPKIITTFDGDKRFRFIHPDGSTMQEVKDIFYDFAEERAFFGDIYSFISICFRTIQESGGTLNFKKKKLKPIDTDKIFSGIGIDELEDIVVNWGNDLYELKDLLEYEF